VGERYGKRDDMPSAGASAARGDGSTDTPGSVIVRRCRHASSGHPSTDAVADALQRPTRALGRAALDRALSGLAPGGVYRAAPVTRHAGGLLHHLFTLTAPRGPKPVTSSGLFSVALACGSPRVGVTHHPALWSPDVPRWTAACASSNATAWSTHPTSILGGTGGSGRPPSDGGWTTGDAGSGAAVPVGYS
jgi:hypothetical protein